MFHSLVRLVFYCLSLRVNVNAIVTFVNAASDEWDRDDLVHESRGPITANTSDTDPSPGRQLDTLLEVTTGFNSSFQHVSIHHGLERAQTKSLLTLSLREASLMRSFIQKIAPWVSDIISIRLGSENLAI